MMAVEWALRTSAELIQKQRQKGLGAGKTLLKTRID